jgi:alanyl-tRNA synthetase
VASGIRRIEAVTGVFAYSLIKEDEKIIADAASILNVPKAQIVQQLQTRLSRIKALEKEDNTQKLEMLKGSVDKLIQDAQVIKDMKLVTRVMENLDMDLLRKAVDLIKEKTDNAIIALGSQSGSRALLVMGITQDLCAKGFNASALVRDIAGVIGGSGGGRQDFAQAGGTKPENLEAAFKKLSKMIVNK